MATAGVSTAQGDWIPTGVQSITETLTMELNKKGESQYWEWGWGVKDRNANGGRQTARGQSCSNSILWKGCFLRPFRLLNTGKHKVGFVVSVGSATNCLETFLRTGMLGPDRKGDLMGGRSWKVSDLWTSAPQVVSCLSTPPALSGQLRGLWCLCSWSSTPPACTYASCCCSLARLHPWPSA